MHKRIETQVYTPFHLQWRDDLHLWYMLHWARACPLLWSPPFFYCWVISLAEPCSLCHSCQEDDKSSAIHTRRRVTVPFDHLTLSGLTIKWGLYSAVSSRSCTSLIVKLAPWRLTCNALVELHVEIRLSIAVLGAWRPESSRLWILLITAQGSSTYSSCHP